MVDVERLMSQRKAIWKSKVPWDQKKKKWLVGEYVELKRQLKMLPNLRIANHVIVAVETTEFVSKDLSRHLNLE